MYRFKGFNILEMLIVLAILGVVLALVSISYKSAYSKKNVAVTADAIGARLEEARSNAITGKDGTNWGVKFNTIGYVYFTGASFNPAASTNASSAIATHLLITTSLTGGASSVLFNRLNGSPSVVGTITITDTTNASSTATITVGSSGDISVIK